MNYLKVQTECLKAVYNNKHNYSRDVRWLCGRYDDETLFVSDGHVGYFIPQTHIMLDLETMFGSADTWFKPKHLVDSNAADIVFTDGMIARGKDRLCIFKRGDEKIYVNEKLLKLFNVKNSTFKGNGYISPILVYECETLVGVVLPTRVKEGE